VASKRTPQTAAKREREQARRERQARKQAKKAAVAAERRNPTPVSEDVEGVESELIGEAASTDDDAPTDDAAPVAEPALTAEAD
jgi:hypothetical protein